MMVLLAFKEMKGPLVLQEFLVQCFTKELLVQLELEHLGQQELLGLKDNQ